jgi:hypothetical protein
MRLGRHAHRTAAVVAVAAGRPVMTAVADLRRSRRSTGRAARSDDGCRAAVPRRAPRPTRRRSAPRRPNGRRRGRRARRARPAAPSRTAPSPRARAETSWRLPARRSRRCCRPRAPGRQSSCRRRRPAST